MQKWKCTICEYVYDPEKGDPDNDVEPGTPFEEIPDDWVCPECGAGKEDFEPVDEVESLVGKVAVGDDEDEGE